MKRPAETYSPLYFLASLGAGGLTVTFFMYLMFWVPHPNQPVPIFEDILAAVSTGTLPMKAAILVAIFGIAGFAILNVTSLIWNLRAFATFRRTEAYDQMMSSNAESSVLAMPLALAMTVNAMFIVGLVFVPGLWSIVEYLFPLAMLSFVGIGILALRQLGRFLGRILTTHGAFSIEGHNSFAQMMPAFALSMVGVGLAAPSAMSQIPTVIATSLVLSTGFAIVAIVYGLFAAVTGLNAMLKHGVAREAAPSLMVVVPITTVLGILLLRQNHGLHLLGGHGKAADSFALLTRLLSIQAVFLGLGLLVLLKQRYFDDFVFGTKTSPGSYALVCPGVAVSVMLHFWINKGLVATELLTKFSPAYWALTAVALILQVAMIALVLRLNRQHFSSPAPGQTVPAE